MVGFGMFFRVLYFSILYSIMGKKVLIKISDLGCLGGSVA